MGLVIFAIISVEIEVWLLVYGTDSRILIQSRPSIFARAASLNENVGDLEWVHPANGVAVILGAIAVTW